MLVSRIEGDDTAGPSDGGFSFSVAFGDKSAKRQPTRLAQPPLKSGHQIFANLPAESASIFAEAVRSVQDRQRTPIWVMIDVGGFNDIEFYC